MKRFVLRHMIIVRENQINKLVKRAIDQIKSLHSYSWVYGNDYSKIEEKIQKEHPSWDCRERVEKKIQKKNKKR